MIVIEQRLNDAFEQLPIKNGFKPIYKWGNEMHLNSQIKLFNESNKSPYPLIYQLSNSSNQSVIERTANTDLVFILACRNLDTTLLNENRWAMSYKELLYPLLIDIETTFHKAGIFRWNGKYKITEFPNYGNNEKNVSIDIWDALKLETSIEINNNCINKIKY